MTLFGGKTNNIDYYERVNSLPFTFFTCCIPATNRRLNLIIHCRRIPRFPRGGREVSSGTKLGWKITGPQTDEKSPAFLKLSFIKRCNGTTKRNRSKRRNGNVAKERRNGGKPTNIGTKAKMESFNGGGTRATESAMKYAKA